MTLRRAREELSVRLKGRRAEMELTAMTRILAISDKPGALGPEYHEGLRAAISAAIDYALTGIESDSEHFAPVPTPLLTQARLAARSGISLDTVMRRCFVGHALFGDFVMSEAQADDRLGDAALKHLLSRQATLFDRLMEALAGEYTREANRRPRSTEERRAEQVRRLLAGEPLGTVEIAYDFEASHLGVIAKGHAANETTHQLAQASGCQLLAVCSDDDAVWGWLGSRRPLRPEELCRLASSVCPAGVVLAIGEPALGLTGWRLTHRQASAALTIAQHVQQNVTRYADVALLVSLMRDDLLATSLHQLYLAPLEGERDGGEVLRETLRAYLSSGQNVSAAAASLGVSRQTVGSRLRTIEVTIGRVIERHATEMELALRLHSFRGSSASKTGLSVC